MWRSLRVIVCCVSALAGSSVQHESRFVDANGVRLYVELDGSGDPIVLIHGWTLNLRMWDPQIGELSRHYKVVRFDRRGFGRSSGSEDTSWDADDLRAVLDALGIARAHVLGMSQGGRVALTFAVTHPERVASLILHGSSAPDGFSLPFNGADRVPQAELEALAKREGLDAARRKWAAHPLLEIPPDHRAAKRLMNDLLAAYRGGRWLNPVPPSGPARFATMADLAALRAPTLVVTGDREVPYLRIVSDSLAYGIRGARRAVIPGGGHMVNIINPPAYNRAVLEFLRLSRTPG
jgi:pimeloyl-ACP methyl ester carboxylesterase